jgi:hypothetical protein
VGSSPAYMAETRPMGTVTRPKLMEPFQSARAIRFCSSDGVRVAVVACRDTATTCCAATRRLRGATIAFVAVTGFAPRLRLAASISGQRPATLVHLLEPASGGSPSEERRISRLQQLALA